MSGSSTPPGWYPDPQQPGMQRYWDGVAWTDATQAAAPAGGYAPPPYGAPGYGAPGYATAGYGMAAMGPPPPNYLVWSILTTLFCCLPAGIVSIVMSSQVNGKWAAGDVAGAQRSSQQAKTWAIVSASVSLVLVVIYLIAVAAASSSSSDF